MRSGITPVVAIVLLLGMTVAASGGAYAWITATTQDAQEDTSASLNTRVEVRALTCGRGVIDVALKNTGSTGVSTDEADLFVYADGDLHTSRTGVDLSSYTLSPADLIRPRIFVPEVLKRGTRYTVELVFPDEGVSVESTCDGSGSVGATGIWTFDEKVPGNVTDTAGRNDGTFITRENNGTVSGASWVSGVVGSHALRFDGSDDNVQVPSSAALNSPADTDEFTLTAWITNAGNSDSGKIIDRWGGTCNSYQLMIYSGAIRVAAAGDGDTAPQTLQEQTGWTFVAGTYNGTHVAFYENGESRGTVTESGGIAGCTMPVGIGSRHGGSANFYNGSIDDARIYDRALNATEIGGLYNGSTVREGLVGEWTFDEGDGSVAHDTSKWVDGRTGLGVTFDGVDDFVNISGASATYTAFTVQAWFRTADPTVDHQVVCQWDGINNIQLKTNEGSDGDLDFYVEDGDGESVRADISGSGSTDGTWHHVTGVFDRGNASLYLDGEVVDTETSGVVDSWELFDNPLNIGRCTNQVQYWNGTIDEVQVYPFAVR